MPDPTPSVSTTEISEVVIPKIKEWLGANYEKITSFWLYADWRMWARFDLYAHLEQTMTKKLRDEYPYWDYSARHSKAVWGDEDDEKVPLVDIAIDRAAEQPGMKPVGIWICPARPHENCDSWQDFVKKFQKEWTLVHELTEKHGSGDLEGGKLLFLGIGEEKDRYPDEPEFEIDGRKPESFGFGAGDMYAHGLFAYYLWMDFPEPKDESVVSERSEEEAEGNSNKKRKLNGH